MDVDTFACLLSAEVATLDTAQGSSYACNDDEMYAT